MAEDLKGVFASGLDVVAEELRQDVIEETKDLVEDLNQVLNGFRGDRILPKKLLRRSRRSPLPCGPRQAPSACGSSAPSPTGWKTI